MLSSPDKIGIVEIKSSVSLDTVLLLRRKIEALKSHKDFKGQKLYAALVSTSSIDSPTLEELKNAHIATFEVHNQLIQKTTIREVKVDRGRGRGISLFFSVT